MKLFSNLFRRGGGVKKILQRIENKVDRLEEKLNIMNNKIKKWAEDQEADLTELQTTLNAVAEGVQKLDQAITELQNSPGEVTPEDQAMLDRIQNLSKGLVTKAKEIQVDADDMPKGGGNGEPTGPEGFSTASRTSGANTNPKSSGLG